VFYNNVITKKNALGDFVNGDVAKTGDKSSLHCRFC